MKRPGLSLLLSLSLVPAVAGAETPAPFPRVLEAEAAVVSGGDGTNADSVWASGGKTAPGDWGEAGDTIKWSVTLDTATEGLRFGLRYARGHDAPEGGAKSGYALRLAVDDRQPVSLPVPVTGSDEDFETVAVDLPRLAAGPHRFHISAPNVRIPARVDAAILFRGQLSALPAPLRRTIVARSATGHFLLRATPDAVIRPAPNRILREFERIHAHFRDFIGWAPERAIGIHLYTAERWPMPGASAFQNERGVHFRAEVMENEQGNWCHEMTHMFYLGHIPRWMDEPSCHALTLLVWMPALYPDLPDTKNARALRSRATGEEVWKDPEAEYDSIEPLLDALIVRYGPDAFRRFFHACRDAGERGEVEWRPEHRLRRDEVVRFMSEAAGEDVTPLFRRWRGFETAP